MLNFHISQHVLFSRVVSHVGRVLTDTDFFFSKGWSLGLVGIFYKPLFQENFNLKKLPFGISAMLIK